MAYKTVSSAASMVVAGIIPAHLLAWERTMGNEIRKESDKIQNEKEIREEVFARWQKA